MLVYTVKKINKLFLIQLQPHIKLMYVLIIRRVVVDALNVVGLVVCHVCIADYHFSDKS